MVGSNSDALHQAVAAFTAEHHDQLKAYAGRDKQTTWLAQGFLAWARAGARTDEEEHP